MRSEEAGGRATHASRDGGVRAAPGAAAEEAKAEEQFSAPPHYFRFAGTTRTNLAEIIN